MIKAAGKTSIKSAGQEASVLLSELRGGCVRSAGGLGDKAANWSERTVEGLIIPGVASGLLDNTTLA